MKEKDINLRRYDSVRLTHYTNRRNVGAIRKGGILRCALSLMSDRERKGWAEKARRDCVLLESGAVLRDQSPLTERLVFSDGATLAQFVRYLNGHVFFWPDRFRGKKCHDSFRAKYRRPKNVGLRFGFADLREANPKAEFLYSPYNSGSMPRNPKESPRSLCLFQPLQSRGSERLVEIVVRGKIRLPENTEVEDDNGKWGLFF